MVEFLTPLAYCLTFTMAFYGANAYIIGGVRFSGWQFVEVKDIGNFLSEAVLMFIADFVCMITSGILLWKFASINVLLEGFQILRLYWPLISIAMAGSMFTVIMIHKVSTI